MKAIGLLTGVLTLVAVSLVALLVEQQFSCRDHREAEAASVDDVGRELDQIASSIFSGTARLDDILEITVTLLSKLGDEDIRPGIADSGALTYPLLEGKSWNAKLSIRGSATGVADRDEYVIEVLLEHTPCYVDPDRSALAGHTVLEIHYDWEKESGCSAMVQTHIHHTRELYRSLLGHAPLPFGAAVAFGKMGSKHWKLLLESIPSQDDSVPAWKSSASEPALSEERIDISDPRLEYIQQILLLTKKGGY